MLNSGCFIKLLRPFCHYLKQRTGQLPAHCKINNIKTKTSMFVFKRAKGEQTRRHWGALVGLAPSNKTPRPQIENVKHYK